MDKLEKTPGPKWYESLLDDIWETLTDCDLLEFLSEILSDIEP